MNSCSIPLLGANRDPSDEVRSDCLSNLHHPIHLPKLCSHIGASDETIMPKELHMANH